MVEQRGRGPIVENTSSRRGCQRRPGRGRSEPYINSGVLSGSESESESNSEPESDTKSKHFGEGKCCGSENTTSRHCLEPVPVEIKGKLQWQLHWRPQGQHSVASVKIMEDFLWEGELNLAHVPTQKGFLKVFAARIIEDDLLFTTGESPDTTVRNTLIKIFDELHFKVFRELKNLIERAMNFHPIEEKERRAFIADNHAVNDTFA
ncbi:hypothetical protein JAAARDRAFT_51385 [Jaapia argillacea MUCL 33604]|uniref:Uncharacterized protein n=1 Tax=Jaapia argillacea MUCL 33604 TaxID=933084 RepID=A0A067P5V3_9AGAM|nr:hypothetical protein JAAARDRAFT_51385 [Jaapia argillacea MUCL 33604]